MLLLASYGATLSSSPPGEYDKATTVCLGRVQMWADGSTSGAGEVRNDGGDLLGRLLDLAGGGPSAEG
jgi:hypothetical protein